MLRTLRLIQLPRTVPFVRPFAPRQPVAPRGRALLGLIGGSGVATARFMSTPVAAEGAAAASSVPSAGSGSSVGTLPEQLILYQYSVCPFCNKLRAFLDFHQIPYQVVEVNPLSKKELEFSTYKKVPVVVVNGDTQLNDSALIMDQLTQQLIEAGKFDGAEAPEGKKWSEWADTKLVQALTVSIYRSPSEALQAMDYITSHPEISMPLVNKYVGGLMMYSLTHLKLKKKYDITDERPNLYKVMDEWIAAVGPNKFLGGDQPSRPDLEVFGMLRAVREMDTFSDIQQNTKIAAWFDAMTAAVETKSA